MNREYWESEIGRFAWKRHLELNARRRREQEQMARKMSELPDTFDDWKTRSPDDERVRHLRIRRKVTGTCDCCAAKGVTLRRAWVNGLETWACPDCTGEN